jgi:glyoxylase-like metal-dependent hydrolase (beta-lactamase superfamily II)
VCARRALLSGDTLFIGSCGRTDLPGADANAMFESLTVSTELHVPHVQRLQSPDIVSLIRNSKR